MNSSQNWLTRWGKDKATNVWAGQAGFITTTSSLSVLNHTKCVRASLLGGGQFWSRLKAELLEGGTFSSVEDARTEIFEYIEIYYNRVCKHSSLGYKSPEQFEDEYYIKLANSVCHQTGPPH